MPLDLVARTLADSGWMIEELVGNSEARFLFGASEVGSLVGASEAGSPDGASETEILSLGATPFGCCSCDRLVETSQMALLGTAPCCA